MHQQTKKLDTTVSPRVLKAWLSKECGHTIPVSRKSFRGGKISLSKNNDASLSIVMTEIKRDPKTNQRQDEDYSFVVSAEKMNEFMKQHCADSPYGEEELKDKAACNPAWTYGIKPDGSFNIYCNVATIIDPEEEGIIEDDDDRSEPDEIEDPSNPDEAKDDSLDNSNDRDTMRGA